jgi:hypothetical protein
LVCQPASPWCPLKNTSAENQEKRERLDILVKSPQIWTCLLDYHHTTNVQQAI